MVNENYGEIAQPPSAEDVNFGISNTERIVCLGESLPICLWELTFMTRGDLRENISKNLADANVTFYSIDDINNSIQDGYNEVVAFAQPIVKHIQLQWQAGVNYYDFLKQMGISDYMGCLAIFNDMTNQWLRDDLSIRDFDRLRRDWEKWNGTPQFWTPHSLKYVAVAPKLASTVADNKFTLWYYGIAPTLQSDDDAFLIAADKISLLEYYSTADLLESAEENVKANEWWTEYDSDLPSYKERCHNLARYQLLQRV